MSAFRSFVTLTLSLTLALACSKQEEGEVCDFANGNDDCASGLVCKQPADLGRRDEDFARCCPKTGGSGECDTVGNDDDDEGTGGVPGSAGSSNAGSSNAGSSNAGSSNAGAGASGMSGAPGSAGTPSSAGGMSGGGN
jgi:hypothetical protein